MRTLVIGDVHGSHKALIQVLERSKFDYENDQLITLGDIVDGWSDVYECVETLLKIKNRIDIKGNHDDWFYHWLTRGEHPTSWLQGGLGTLKSYLKNCIGDENAYSSWMGGYLSKLTKLDIPKSHLEFFENQRLYYIDSQRRIFVHGGFDRNQYIDYLEKFYPEDFYWNRDLWNKALSCHEGQKLLTQERFKEIFIGHTATVNWKDKNHKPITTPMSSGDVWDLDTGAGWYGKLTIMDVETKEYWQSDNVQDLYPNEK